MSLNRSVFKRRLKVRMFSHSRMSAGREFQTDGAATEKARRASSVCRPMRGTTSSGALEERSARGGGPTETYYQNCYATIHGWQNSRLRCIVTTR